MVFEFHVHAAANSHRAAQQQGSNSHVHHQHPDDISPHRADPTFVAVGAQGTSHVHPVLNNGHSIKHLVARRGYATAADGVRLFFEVFETSAVPAKGSTVAAGSTDAALAVSASTTSAAQSVPPPRLDIEQPASTLAPPLGKSPNSCTGCAGRQAANGPVQPSNMEATEPGAGAVNGACMALPSEGGAATAPCGAVVTPSGRHHPSAEEPNACVEADGASGASYCSGEAAAAEVEGEVEETGVANVLLIMGFAAGRDGWLPLVDHWMSQAGSETLHHLRPRFCVFDNRGIGASDSPGPRGSYSTEIMAGDAQAVMDHLGWRRAHVVGFSMGGMVALKLGATAPQRLLSLTALSVTNGGWQVIPTKWRALKLLAWAALARTPQQRAHADVHFHFSRETLHAEVPLLSGAAKGSPGMDAAPARTQRVEAALIDEYVATSQSAAAQPHTGLMGQLHAVWTHGLTAAEQQRLRQLHMPLKVIHGYHDMMAMPEYGERIAKHVRGVFIMVHGGHFIARECAPEVCLHVADSIASSQKLVEDARGAALRATGQCLLASATA